MRVNEPPAQLVGPVNSCQLLPRLSLTPLMATGAPFHPGCVDTNAISVDALRESNAVVVCAASGVPLMYPRVLTTDGGVDCARADDAADRTSARAKENHRHVRINRERSDSR